MRMGREMKWMGVLVVAAMLGVGVEARGALVNPSFETGDLSGWSTFGPGWRISGGADAHSGSYGVVNDVFPSDPTGYRGLYQGVSATAGLTYSGGVWIATVNRDTSVSFFEVQFLNASNGVIEQHQSASVTTNQPFTFVGLSDLVAPAGTVSASVRAIVFMPDSPLPSGTNFHIFDDFTFAAVPEPGTMGLVALGAAVMAWRRKR